MESGRSAQLKPDAMRASRLTFFSRSQAQLGNERINGAAEWPRGVVQKFRLAAGGQRRWNLGMRMCYPVPALKPTGLDNKCRLFLRHLSPTSCWAPGQSTIAR